MNPYSDIAFGYQEQAQHTIPQLVAAGVVVLPYGQEHFYDLDEDREPSPWVWYQQDLREFNIEDEVGNHVGEVGKKRRADGWYWCVFWECGCCGTEKSREGAEKTALLAMQAAQASAPFHWGPL